MNLPRSVWAASFTRSKSEVRVKRRIFGKKSERSLRISIIDLTIHNRTAGFYCTAKKSSPEALAGRLFATKRRAELRRGRWRRYINVRLRFGLRLALRSWRFFYDRRVAFLLLARWICHCGFFLLTTHEQCGSGKDENIFFHNGRELDSERLRRW